MADLAAAFAQFRAQVVLLYSGGDSASQDAASIWMREFMQSTVRSVHVLDRRPLHIGAARTHCVLLDVCTPARRLLGR
jgi:hypothetical protein